MRDDGCLLLSRLELVDKPIPWLNPFSMLPPGWVSDRNAVERAGHLWEQMGRPLQHLFNAVLWDGGRFVRFVTGPVSTSDYPWQPGGNFRHAVTVAEQAAALSKGLSDVSTPVVIAAALLNDAGKADEFRLSQDGNGYVLSERGHWIGFQHTILEWLAVARV